MMVDEKQLSALGECVEFYIEDCLARGQSNATAKSKETLLNVFIKWCAHLDIHSIHGVDKFVLEKYRRHIAKHRKVTDGEPLSPSTQRMRLMAVTGLIKRLGYFDVLDPEFAERFELPKAHRPIPKDIPEDEEEVEMILNQTLTGRYAIRDRAILEVYYATAIRRSELAKLNIRDIDFKLRMVTIRSGKGRRDRRVPIAQRALDWVEKYIKEFRPRHATIESGDTLFLTKYGNRIKPKILTEMVGNYIQRSGIGKKGACHSFRHAAATQMLRNGADIRHVQEMLGHLDISSTQIYARVTVKDLNKVYHQTHPAALNEGGRGMPNT